MKSNWFPNFAYNRFRLWVLVLAGSITFVGAFAGWVSISINAEQSMAKNDDKKPTDQRPVTVTAEKRGLPNISLANGTDLNVPTDGLKGEQPSLLVSADFDSDGTDDLVVADQGGNIRLYHGIPEAKHSLMLKVQGRDAPEPFSRTATNVSLGISPDYLETGDFNADGHKDVLAAAKGSSSIIFVAGLGNGSFSEPRSIKVDGQITALAVGDIGTSDGQTDVAVAVSNSKGSKLLVFEHPEGAFKHDPEVFKLSAPANDIAFGDLNGDHYSDIAVACGASITIIGGRGQAYPWDLNKNSGVVRPNAVVESRRLSSPAIGIAIGKFNGDRTSSVAVMTVGGTIFTLGPSGPLPFRKITSRHFSGKNVLPKFAPTGVTPSTLLNTAPVLVQGDPNPADGTMRVEGHLAPDEIRLATAKQYDASVKAMRTKTKEEQSSIITQARLSRDPQRTKQSFLDSIAGQPLDLSQWKVSPIISNGDLASVGAGRGRVLRTARVSFGNNDDLIVLNSAAKKIDVIVQPSNDLSSRDAQLVSFDAESAPLAVLPMRLNGDALDDLVVLRAGSGVPTVVPTTPTSIIIVNSTADDGSGVCDGVGPCTLRRAMEIAAFNAGTIVAVLIPGPGVHTIIPVSELPTIHAPGVYLAAGVGLAGEHLQEISGDLAGFADGVKIRASNCTVQDFVINGFHGYQDPDTGSITGGNAITSESTTLSPNNGNNTFVRNYLGTDATGTIKKANDDGLLVFDSDGNTIVDNVLSGNSVNGFGYGLDVTAGNNNIIHGNRIGTSAAGNVRLANDTGVYLTGSNNQFGGDGVGDGNTVSGNGRDRQPGNPNYPGCDGYGMSVLPLYDVLSGQQLTELNYVKGNRMGTSSDGTQRLGNCYYALITLAQDMTVIGSITATGRNVISDNGLDGLWCGIPGSQYNAGGFCAIIGNNIGTDITGTVSMGNSSRNLQGGLQFITAAVFIDNSDTFSNIGAPGGMDPGGPCTGFCNLISGQSDSTPGGPSEGILGRYGWGTVGVFNNYIGTDTTGTQSIPNSVSLFMGNALINAGTSYVGWYGTNPDVSLGNLFSGNDYGSIGCGSFSYTAGECLVLGNLIGTDASGNNPLPNGLADSPFQNTVVRLATGTGNSAVGDSTPLGRNVISANYMNGIETRNFVGDNRIVNNFIGVNRSGAPLGNQGNGIQVEFGSAEIGTSSPEDKNIISNNGGNGIFLSSPYAPTFLTTGVNIVNNSIGNNSGLGIDILPTGYANSGDGVTPNDCSDADTGTNEVQNFPVLAAPVFNGNGTVTVSGFLNSEPFRDYRVDFYASSTVDPSNYGEGENFIGTINISTNSIGVNVFTFNSPGPVLPSSIITATATNENGSTSEFSCAAGVCSGQVMKDGKLDPAPATCPIQEIVVNVNGDQDEDPGFRGTDCNVDPNATPGNFKCTLRAAIEESIYRNNAGSGRWNIKFNIPVPYTTTISPQTPLPAISKPMTIQGTSQPGYTNSPLIELTGVNLAAGAINGLNFVAGSDGSTVNGLVINRFGGAGIAIANANDISITSSFLGTNVAGDSSFPSNIQNAGVSLSNSNGSHIGATTANDGNLISGNQVGVSIVGGSDNTVTNCKIGTDKNGFVAIANAAGIIINGSTGNFIGGAITAGANSSVLQTGNLIAGNRPNDGVLISSSGSTSPDNNTVKGNFIGINLNVSPLANGSSGIKITQGTNNTVGTAGSPNLVSGFTGADSSGIFVASTAPVGNKINGNYVGTDAIGAHLILHNNDGITIQNNGTDVFGNKISNNTRYGINISPGLGGGYSPSNNTIRANRFGHDGPNNTGIFLDGTTNTIGGSDQDANTISFSAVNGVWVADGATDNTIKKNFIRDGNGSSGVLLVGYENYIIGNTITNNPLAGIRVEHGTQGPADQENHIQGNFIGTNSNGDVALGNATGIMMTNGAQKNYVEATVELHPQVNVISGNTAEGIRIGSLDTGNAPSGNIVTSNLIGTNPAGSGPLPNQTGIFLSAGATNNVIGDGFGSPLTVNTISGNTRTGILIGEESIGSAVVTGNKIQQNRIGLSGPGVNPVVAVPNNIGIGLGKNAVANVIGGHLADTGNGSTNHDGNVISGNTRDGILICSLTGTNVAFGCPNGGANSIDPPSSNKIQGNLIGVSGFGSTGTAIGNGVSGIDINYSGPTLIGGDNDAFGPLGNIIGGNRNDGITIAPSDQTQIIKNFIGVNDNGVVIQGDNGTGNRLSGINSINSTCALIRSNWIGGNQFYGIDINNGFPATGQQYQTSVIGNLIGVALSPGGSTVTAANGTNIGSGLNGGGGIFIHASQVNVGIPSASEDAKNVISANVGDGVRLENQWGRYSTVTCNYIGTDVTGANLGNTGNGVFITNGANNNNIGVVNPVFQNIWYNGVSGVSEDPTAGPNNKIDPNSFFGNAVLGIDLDGSGAILQNDPDDGDMSEGGNRLQNYPEITGESIDGDGNLIVSYFVDSLPGNSNYGADGLPGLRVELFKADARGQGQVFLGADQYAAADYNSFDARRKRTGRPASPSTAGAKTINLGNAAALGFGPGDRVTATATDVDGNTSEFFPPFAPSAGGTRVSGTVVDTLGRPVDRATVTITAAGGAVRTALTNPFGLFEIGDVEVGETYVATVRHRTLTFRSQIITVSDQVTDLRFTAEP